MSAAALAIFLASLPPTAQVMRLVLWSEEGSFEVPLSVATISSDFGTETLGWPGTL